MVLAMLIGLPMLVVPAIPIPVPVVAAVPALIATASAALVTTVAAAGIAAVATEVLPQSVSHNIEALHRRVRVVALDDQLAGFRVSLGRAVLNHDLEACTGAQRGRERIVDQAEVTVFMPELHRGYMQAALADVADKDTLFDAAAALDATEDRRTRDGQLSGGHQAVDIDGVGTRGIVAGYSDDSRPMTQVVRVEPNGDLERASGFDRQRV
jgi:hypothetical protein